MFLNLNLNTLSVSLPTSTTETVVGVVILLFCSILIAFFKSDPFKDWITGLFNKMFKSKKKREEELKLKEESQNEKKSYSIKEEDIINHDIFNYIEFWIYNQVPSINLRTEYRTAVFKKYLHIYFKSYKETISEFTKDGSYKTMSDSKLRKSLLSIITNTTVKMDMDMRSAGIPDVIISKMKSKLSERVNLTVDLIYSICDSAFYDGNENYLKIYSFLNIVHSILDNTISNVTPICNGLNGELSGLSIDGFTEPPSKHSAT